MTVPSHPRREDAVRDALVLMAAAMLAFAALDGARKAMAETVPAGVIVGSRYVVFVVVVLGWLRREGRSLFASSHPWLQLLRAVVMVTEATVFVYALRYASLADANAVFALSPVAGTFLAVVILGERARPATWLALAASLAGALVMLRPSGHSRELGLLLALVSAFLYALYGILTRRVSDRDAPRTSFSYMTVGGAIGAVVLAGIQERHWHAVTTRAALLLLLAAAAAGVGQYLLIRAYAVAKATTLQPYNSLLFAWSIPISLVFFGTAPSPWAGAGGALVVAVGCYLFLAEPRESARRPRGEARHLRRRDWSGHFSGHGPVL